VAQIHRDGRWARILNIGLLIGGFGLGQGSIFAAQTWLVARSELDLLAAFGTSFSFAILGTMFVDAGAITVLARHVAHLSAGQASRKEISLIFWETSLVRLMLALLIVLGGGIYAMAISAEPFTSFYVLLASPGFLLCAINAAGMLDGLKLSGVSGLTGSIIYVVSAVALIFAPHVSRATAGALLGGVFSIGNFLTVLLQWGVLDRHGLRPARPEVTRSGLMRSVKDGLAMLCGTLPGQLYFRFQLLLSTTFLGTEITAFLLYAKQIVSGMTQLIGFVLRVEFPTLVQLFAQPDKHNLATIFGAQKLASFLAIGSTIATLFAGIGLTFAKQRNFSEVGWLLIAFSPTILTISIMWIVAQALAALSRYTVLAFIITIFVVVGMVVSYLALTSYGVYALILGDMASHATGMLLLYLFLRGEKRVDPLPIAREA
jgi:O-antigen/teichoic acid export membrane protein